MVNRVIVGVDFSEASRGALAKASAWAKRLEAPLVQEARTFLQGRLFGMTLNQVREAYTQVVAGLNVKLVCEVQEEDGLATWQFVAFRSLDGHWHFHSALRLG